MNLGSDPWPICLEPSGKEGQEGMKVDLKGADRGGDSVCWLEHCVEKFEGKEGVQVFVRYNQRKAGRARGDMFDKRLHLGLPSWFKR